MFYTFMIGSLEIICGSLIKKKKKCLNISNVIKLIFNVITHSITELLNN